MSIRTKLSILTRATLVTLGAPALIAACAVTPADDDGTVASASEALQAGGGPILLCKTLAFPKEKACNTVSCVADAWEYSPEPNGAYCTTTAGAAGTCQTGACYTDLSGSIFPSYYVLSVEYAPPGAASTVDYGSGTTWDSTTSTTDAWSNSLDITVSNKESLFGFGAGGLSVDTGVTNSGSTKDSTELKTTTQTDFTIDGDVDAVDHGLDRIYLWLSPEVDVTSYANNVSWSMTTRAGQTPHIIYVTPTWLLNNDVPSDVLQALQQAGITPADYPQILSVDPFAQGATALDTTRFIFQTELPYEPVTVAGEKPTTSKFAISTSTGTTATTESKVEYKVGATVSGSLGFLSFASVGLKVSDTFSWSNDNSASIAKTTTLSASATITQPAFGYTGPIYLDVYLDSIFNTFVFVLNQPKIFHPFPLPIITVPVSAKSVN